MLYMVSKRTLDIPNPRKRTFWISEEVDVALRMKAVRENVRFSDEAEIAFRQYLGLKQMKRNDAIAQTKDKSRKAANL